MSGGEVELRLSEVLSGLSHALDITEGQARGHAERSCLLGMAIAASLQLDAATRSSLFYALLLKDAGCSSNAAKVAALFGADDATVKSSRRLTDTSSTSGAVRHVLRTAAPDAPLSARGRRIAAILRAGRASARSLVELRCERGAAVARSIGLDEVTARAILDVDEHWDGGGFPAGLAGEEISLAGRVLCVAQTAEVFWQRGGSGAACAVARERRGTWFDPILVDALLGFEHDHAFWDSLRAASVTALEPPDHVIIADDAALDRVAGAFASIVDAKSPYTARHSAGVAELATDLASLLGLELAARATLHRAALLHDVGKLGVSNRILDKPGRLDDREWAVIRRHPEWSLQIIARVGALQDEARIAAAHHERLDGSGYHQRLTAAELDLPSRILAVADVAEALSADRPYRAARSIEEVLIALRPDDARGLDRDVLSVLADVLPGWSARAQAPAPAGAGVLR